MQLITNNYDQVVCLIIITIILIYNIKIIINDKIIMIMKIITWNINGKKDVIENFVSKENPDVLFLTEIKTANIPNIEGYDSIVNRHNPQKYHGVSMIIRSSIKYTILDVDLKILPRYDTKSDRADNGRVISIRVGNYNIVGVYSPNSGVDGLKNIVYRIDQWDTGLSNYLSSMQGETILIGDLNIAFSDLDVSNASQMKKWPGFTERERSSFREKMKDWIDPYRLYDPKGRQYTWIGRSSKPNYGMRLDHILVNSNNLFNKIYTVSFYTDIKISDHIPIDVIIDLE